MKKWATFKYRLELGPADIFKLRVNIGVQTMVYIYAQHLNID